MNDITNEDLKEIENLASLFFTPREIAIMLEIDPSPFINAIGLDNDPRHYSDIQTSYRAFQSGRLKSEMELRKSIIKLSKSGSSPAQTMALDLLIKSKLKMGDR